MSKVWLVEATAADSDAAFANKIEVLWRRAGLAAAFREHDLAALKLHVGVRPGQAVGWYNWSSVVHLQSGDRGYPPTAATGSPTKLDRTLARIINIVIILAAIRDPVHELTGSPWPFWKYSNIRIRVSGRAQSPWNA